MMVSRNSKNWETNNQEANSDELEQPREQGNDGEQELQESGDSDELAPREQGDGVLQELQEPGHSKRILLSNLHTNYDF
jgi:hypothetical protein